jgi:hypothetical protein
MESSKLKVPQNDSELGGSSKFLYHNSNGGLSGCVFEMDAYTTTVQEVYSDIGRQ